MIINRELLQNANVPGIKIMVPRYLAIEMFKCIKGINPAYLNAMFTRKECPYALRDSSILVRPKVKLTQYGLKSFKSYGAKIWNILPTSYKADISLDEFKSLIKSWDGPKCKLCLWPVHIISIYSRFSHVYVYMCVWLYTHAYIRMHRYMHIHVHTYTCSVSWEISVWFINFIHVLDYPIFFYVLWRSLCLYHVYFKRWYVLCIHKPRLKHDVLPVIYI